MKYTNGVGTNPYAIVLHHIRTYTTSRSRRILIINVLCFVLFATAVSFAFKRRQWEPVMPPLVPNPGDVYYISKRALCTRSIAYSELGIQPIAVSKVILRPVVREPGYEGLEDRLEVLEDGMINDVVFLDRNATEKEAELSASVCPLHTVSILPDRNASRYTASSVIFGITIGVDDIPKAIQHWRFWARSPDIEFLVLLPSSESTRAKEAEQLLREALTVTVHVETSSDTDDFAKLYLSLVTRMRARASSTVKWFAILTPGTFVTSIDDFLLALDPYDASHRLYLGGLSESTAQKSQYGIIAYGGAGVVLSRSLVDGVNKNFHKCLEIEEAPYGDGLLSKCITNHIKTEFTILPTFHQLDVLNDISGILQSPLEFATLYNLVPDSLSLFPSWHRVGSEGAPPTTYADTISLFHRARQTLSPVNWGIRYRFGASGRYLLTNGYSITEFLRPPYPTNHEYRTAVEATFANDNNVEEFLFHGQGAKEVPMRHGLREGDDKRTYYLRAIEMTETRASPDRADPKDRKQAAVFVYVNEYGSVRRGIEVVWLR